MISVRTHLKGVGEGLPRVLHHQPGCCDQVPSDPFEILPIILVGLGEFPHQFLDGKHEVEPVKGKVIEGGSKRLVA